MKLNKLLLLLKQFIRALININILLSHQAKRIVDLIPTGSAYPDVQPFEIIKIKHYEERSLYDIQMFNPPEAAWKEKNYSLLYEKLYKM